MALMGSIEQSADRQSRLHVLERLLGLTILGAVIYYFICLFRACIPYLGRYWHYFA